MSSAQIASSNMAQSKDDFVQFVRHTRDQRVIFYRLKVLQDPERARACGSGAKSSADRRPVDPPPIVQLKVSEGSPENDVTASYPANFFIFVSIEHAESLDSRAQNTGGQPQPVLTGTNVCSMSFLDRPQPAGYFVFPDISVRHEGKYRLIFDLYEDAHEPNIMDINFRPHPSFGDSPPLVKVMEIKSAVFEVFSAKKFPGLMTSTTLSRTFAEQGVRVRIRRDVRMRRRDAKGGAPGHDDDAAHERGRMSATPEAYGTMDRPRSAVSIKSQPLSRRPSMDEMSQTYAPSPIAPQTPNGMYPPQMSAWQAPAAPQAQNTFMQPPAPPAYPQQQSYAPSYPSGQQNTFMPPQYPTRNPTAHSRNASQEIPLPPTGPSPHMIVPAQQYNQAGQPPSPYPTASYNRQVSHPHLQPISTSMQNQQAAEISPNAAYANGAPLQSPIRPNHAMYGHMSQPMSAMSPRQHSFSQQAQPQQMQQMAQAHSYPQYAPIAPPRLEHAPQASGATKRTFSATFDAEHLDARLQHGERPISPVQDSKYQYQSMQPTIASIERDQSNFDLQMTYRRADGTQKKRPMPPGL